MKFLEYINEAVIGTYIKNLKQDLHTALVKVPINSRGSMFYILNKYFDKDKINFKLSRKNKEGIEGYIDPETLKIDIEIGIVHVLFTEISMLVQHLSEVITHELIHRDQISKSNKKASLYKMSGNDTKAKAKEYLANKYEIMAYAAQTVLALRHEGFDDESIISMCKDPEAWYDRLLNSRAHIDIYLIDFFKATDPTAKKFKKYVVEYLEKQK